MRDGGEVRVPVCVVVLEVLDRLVEGGRDLLELGQGVEDVVLFDCLFGGYVSDDRGTDADVGEDEWADCREVRGGRAESYDGIVG